MGFFGFFRRRREEREAQERWERESRAMMRRQQEQAKPRPRPVPLTDKSYGRVIPTTRQSSDHLVSPVAAAAADDDSGVTEAVQQVIEGLIEAVPDTPRRRFQHVDPDAPTVVPASHIDHSRLQVERADPPKYHAPVQDHSHHSYDGGSSHSSSDSGGGGDGGGGGGGD